MKLPIKIENASIADVLSDHIVSKYYGNVRNAAAALRCSDSSIYIAIGGRLGRRLPKRELLDDAGIFYFQGNFYKWQQ